MPSGTKTSLISYDDSDSETDDKVAEQEPSKISNSKEEHTTEDILALLEAEKPPDYLASDSSKSTNQTNPMTTSSNGVSTTANGVGNQYTSGLAPASHQFSAPPPPVIVSQPPLPVRRPQLGSMLQVSS